jgi:hypothetical protein
MFFESCESVRIGQENNTDFNEDAIICGTDVVMRSSFSLDESVKLT